MNEFSVHPPRIIVYDRRPKPTKRQKPRCHTKAPDVEVTTLEQMTNPQFDLNLKDCLVGDRTVDLQRCKAIGNCQSTMEEIFGSTKQGMSFFDEMESSKVKHVYAVKNERFGFGPAVQISPKDSRGEISCVKTKIQSAIPVL